MDNWLDIASIFHKPLAFEKIPTHLVEDNIKQIGQICKPSKRRILLNSGSCLLASEFFKHISLANPNAFDPTQRTGFLRVRAKITSQNWRSDLVQVWLIRESKTTGIVSYFEDFANEASAKDELKRRC